MTERRELDPLSLTLGGIEQQLKSISHTQAEDRNASAIHRTDMKKELREIRDKVQQLENAAVMSAGMSVGAKNLAGLLMKGAHVISAAIGAVLVFLLQRWIGPTH